MLLKLCLVFISTCIIAPLSFIWLAAYLIKDIGGMHGGLGIILLFFAYIITFSILADILYKYRVFG